LTIISTSTITNIEVCNDWHSNPEEQSFKFIDLSKDTKLLVTHSIQTMFSGFFTLIL